MILDIKVMPNSKQEKIEKIGEKKFKIHLREKPVKGKANKELIRFLSLYFKVQKQKISILKGHKSDKKIIEIKIDSKN